MTHKVGPKGQVVIPKDLRDVLGIEPGDEVTFWRDGDHVAVRPMRSSWSTNWIVSVPPTVRVRTAGDRRPCVLGDPSPA